MARAPQESRLHGGGRAGTCAGHRDEPQRRLTTRLYQVDKNEFAVRERKPVRIEELFAALEENNLSNRKGRPRELRGRWRHLGPRFGAMLAVNLTTDEVRHYIRERQQEGASNATVNRELAALKRMLNFGRQSTPPRSESCPTSRC